jgi:hypothetical protein
VHAIVNLLIVKVPAGATYEPITVTVNNLTAYSQKPFVVTFANGGSFTKNRILKPAMAHAAFI